MKINKKTIFGGYGCIVWVCPVNLVQINNYKCSWIIK